MKGYYYLNLSSKFYIAYNELKDEWSLISREFEYECTECYSEITVDEVYVYIYPKSIEELKTIINIFKK